MASKSTPLGVVLEREIRRAFMALGAVEWSPADFVARGLGPEEAIRSALHQLSELGHLEEFAIIRCEDGHDLWRGLVLDALNRNLRAPHDCGVCNVHGDYGAGGIFLRYRPSVAWLEDLRELAAAQKKTSKP